MRSGIVKMLAIAAIGVAVVATGASAEELKLKAGYIISNEKSTPKQAFDAFVAKVNELGKGIVQITQVVGPESIPSREMGNAAKTGLLDIAGTPPAYVNSAIKVGGGLVASRITPNEMRKNGAWAIYEDVFAKRLNTHLLGQFGFEMEFNVYLNKPIKTIDDFKGMKLRTSNTYKPFFDAIGVNALQMARREIFTAMERGVVDGYANIDGEVLVQGWHEVTKYKVDPAFYHVIQVVLVNLDRWKGMTDAQRKVLTDAAAYLEGTVSPGMGAKNKAAGEELVKKGIQVIDLQGKDREEYLTKAYVSQWDVIVDRDPEIGAKLRPLMGQ